MDHPRSARPDPNLSVPPLTETEPYLLDETNPQDLKHAPENRLTRLVLRGFLQNRPIPIFAYGSLQLPHEIALCLNKDRRYDDDENVLSALRMTPGVISHHHVYGIQDSIFPGILEDGTEDDQVPGVVIFGLTEAQRQRLDRRVGSWYCREEKDVNIIMATGEDEVIMAHVYMWARGSQYLLNPDVTKWTLTKFIEERKEKPKAKRSDEDDKDAYQNLINANPHRYTLPAAEDKKRRLEWLASYDRRYARRVAIWHSIQKREVTAVLAQQRGEENIYGTSSTDSDELMREPEDPSQDDAESYRSREELLINQGTTSENQEQSSNNPEEPPEDQEGSFSSVDSHEIITGGVMDP